MLTYQVIQNLGLVIGFYETSAPNYRKTQDAPARYHAYPFL